MQRCGRAKWSAQVVFGVVLGGIALTVTAAACFGVRLNTSCSLPIGLYIRTAGPNAPLIEFCPDEPFAHESSVRGYRSRGTACPDGAIPLLKPVVAVAGDRVTLSPDGIRVNGLLLPQTSPLPLDGKGRTLCPWNFGTYLVEPGTVWVASTFNRGSYDSRYMGPIKVAAIRARLRPLWTL